MTDSSVLSSAGDMGQGGGEMWPTGPDVGMTINAILKIIFYATVIILGVFGNSLIFCVYWSKTQKNSAHVLIMGLAWMDFLVCLMRFYALVKFTSVLVSGGFTPGGFLNAVRVANALNVFASVVLTAAIAVERYDCVCRPRKRLLNHGRAKGLIVASYGVAALIALPLAVNIYNPSLANAKTSGAFQLVLFVAAMLLICLCYGKVYAVIRKHVKVNALSGNAARKGMSTRADAARKRGEVSSIAGRNVSSTAEPSTSAPPPQTLTVTATTGTHWVSVPAPRCSEGIATGDEVQPRPGIAPIPLSKKTTTRPSMSLQQKTTRMLFITTLVFLLSWLSYWVYVAVAVYQYNGGYIHDNVLVVMYNCTLFVYINNVVNPLIYGLANRRFRKDCLDVLRKIKPC